MEINLVNQTAMVVMFAITVGLLITTIGFVGLQHQKLFDDIKHNTDDSDNQTRLIILNVTKESSNATKTIIMNLTYQLSEHDDKVDAKLNQLLGPPH